jgi:hypothetical protein
MSGCLASTYRENSLIRSIAKTMRHQSILAIGGLTFLLSAMSCSPSQQVSQQAAPQAAPPTLPTGAPARSPSIQQDYAPAVPLPATGKVTIRSDIRTLETARLIADCPTDSAPYALAESTNYRVQICSQEYDPWLPKYYIGQSKADQSLIRITSSNPDEARQLMFRNAGYSYVLYRDSARPEQSNAYLQIFTPDGKQYNEALLYLYEIGPPR